MNQPVLSAKAAAMLFSDTQAQVLASIAQASATIWNRTLAADLQTEIGRYLLQMPAGSWQCTGNLRHITAELANNFADYPYLQADVVNLCSLFSEHTDTNTCKIALSVVQSDMCRKFHTDIIDYRMLCTYAGSGTLFSLASEAEPTEDNIQQVAPEAVLLFRGAMSATAQYPALLHRSPAIAQEQGKRLLLRIDTCTRYW